MGTVLEILGVPLVVPLAVIIFLGSFIPIVGILVAGTLAVLVAFGTKGWVAAVIFLIALIIEQQLEGHVLQPMVVGRWVRLHPLAIILAIAIGGVVGGIPGAAVAVPIAAVVYRVWPALRGKDEITAAADPGAPPPAPPPSDSPEEPDGPDGPDGTARDDDAPVDDARGERTSDPAERNR
jgi:predicted PurR-regulated permease PerM